MGKTTAENLVFLQRVRIARNADRCNSQANSVCPSVRLSVTFRCFVLFPASGRTILLLRDAAFPFISYPLPIFLLIFSREIVCRIGA